MVEGHCNNVPESEIVDLFFKAHELIKQQVVWQNQISKELGTVKEQIKNVFDIALWKEKVKKFLPANFANDLFLKPKQERSRLTEALLGSLLKHFENEINTKQVSSSVLSYIFDSIFKDVIPSVMLQKQSRLDGRKFDEVRPISSEVAMLPCVHGSAIFQRGETQALACVTLGTGQDAQKIETLTGGAQERLFMLHYNMPPFSSGEVKPMRATGRREIGHGYLAETSFLNVLPSQEKFPYTIRSVVDILSSNGSTSMAAVCSTALALMDAGVPLQDVVSGIAMGLVQGQDGKYHVLTDILGDEDGFGLMDFKVTGTEKGIMAFQLDIKAKIGFTKELFVTALEQARKGRLHILHEMLKTLTSPRNQLSDLAPRVFAMHIPQDKIGALIGPGGKNIKEIVAKTNTQIDIEDDGTVKIYSKTGAAANEAELWIQTLVGDIPAGSVFNGTIKRISEFGLFVELVPGREGLVHVSTIDRNKQRNLDKLYKINDKLKVKVTNYDKETGRIRLSAPDLEKP
jgi:polyribonucleotide nucleotidyltransferase